MYNHIGRIYSFSISRNNQLQLNFIPCLDTTGTPCMYDTVIRKPFHNFGSEDDDFLTDRTLPDGYTELEYLESTGTQYIDTGVKLSNESEVKCEYETDYIDATNYISAFGTSGSSPHFTNYVTYPESTGNQYVSVYVGNLVPRCYWPREYGKCLLVINGKHASYNGNIITYKDNTPDFETKSNCYVFDGVGAKLVGRVYSFSISRAGVLQADYQPALDDQGKPCMYDFVTNTPLYNKDTTGDDFVYVLPETGTFALRRQDLTSMGSLSKYGLRRIHRLPFNFDGDMEKFITENNIKPIVKTEMPDDGKYYVPQWTQDDEIITLEWIESEPPTIDEITE